MRVFLFSLALSSGLVLFGSAPISAQESGQSVPQQPAPSPESTSKPGPSAGSHANDFLVRGTVFTEEGLALPGAELRIRRASEKKFRWNDLTNSRGDFAIRVKMGSDYEVIVRAKGYQEQSLAVDGKTGERYKDLVFRMQHQGGKKS